MLWSIIVGGFIGFLAGAITNKAVQWALSLKLLLVLIGSSVGQSLFGTWGPSLAGMSLIPSVLGAVIVVAVVSFFFGKKDSPLLVTVDFIWLNVILHERSHNYGIR